VVQRIKIESRFSEARLVFLARPKFDEAGNRNPPNNWASIFGGSAWTWDEGSGQYYLFLFLPSQPDLNWTNEDMRRSTYADMEFWLDKGVDGYRIDSMNLMSKHPELPDAPIANLETEFQSGAQYFSSGPRMHEYVKEMRTEVFDKYDCMTVGELGFTKDEESVSKYVSKEKHELNMLFTGDIVDLDFGAETKYGRGYFRLEKLREITKTWQECMLKFDGWNTIYMDNHDSGRSLSRYAPDLPQFRATAAKMLATYLGSLSGTLFLLQGQETGMANVPPLYRITFSRLTLLPPTSLHAKRRLEANEEGSYNNLPGRASRLGCYHSSQFPSLSLQKGVDYQPAFCENPDSWTRNGGRLLRHLGICALVSNVETHANSTSCPFA